MATLHGKKLTDKQFTALKKKWVAQDKKTWTAHYRSEIAILRNQIKDWQKRIAETKKKHGKPFGLQLNAIKSRQAEIKALQTKIKNL